MRSFLVLFFTPFILFAQPKVNQLDAAGKKQGLWMKYFDENPNALRYKGTFKNDQPVDTFQHFYPTGELQAILYYRKDGYVVSKTYNQGSVLLAHGRYLKQQKDSSWSFYNDYGQLISKEFYIEGKKYGLWKVYHDNGEVAEEKNWENDLENGPCKQFYRSGSLLREVTFEQGSIEGKAIYYHENGQVSSEGIYYHDAKDGLWKEYDPEGNLSKEIRYKKGIPEDGLPVIKTPDASRWYKKDLLEEEDFFPEDQYAPRE